MSHPSASYDALFITEGLSHEFDFALEGEVHTLAYLALLLSLSVGQELEAWGYSFISTASATPFSESLHEAISVLAKRGLVGATGPRLSASNSASSALKDWDDLPGNRRRSVYLQASVAAASALSLPTAVRSVHREPQLMRAEKLGALRALPEEQGLEELRGELKEVDSVLSDMGLGEAGGRGAHVFSRAQLWLSYLACEGPNQAMAE